MVFVGMGLVRYSFARYGDIVNTSFALDTAESFRRWIIMEDPAIEKIANAYRSLVGVEMKKTRRKRNKNNP